MSARQPFPAGSVTYARGMNTPERRATTLELLPLPGKRTRRG